MSRQVSLDEKAIHQATAFLADDPDGLRAVLAAVDALTSDPYPEGAFPFGRPACTDYGSADTGCSTPSPTS